MVPAVILAAGASTRMGRVKALLPVGPSGEPFVAHLVRTFVAAGIDEVVVVGRPGVDLAPAFEGLPRPPRLVENPEPDRGQLSSLWSALRVIDRPGVHAMLVALVDSPLVALSSVQAVLGAYHRTPAPIVRPVSRGRHGHPVLFDRRVFADLRGADPAVGAKAVMRAYQAEILEVEVEDEGAFVDIDSPEDYARVIGSPLEP